MINDALDRLRFARDNARDAAKYQTEQGCKECAAAQWGAHVALYHVVEALGVIIPELVNQDEDVKGCVEVDKARDAVDAFRYAAEAGLECEAAAAKLAVEDGGPLGIDTAFTFLEVDELMDMEYDPTTVYAFTGQELNQLISLKCREAVFEFDDARRIWDEPGS